jgi:hypothetical protein
VQTETETIVLLEPEAIARVAAFLSQLDIGETLSRDTPAMEEAHGDGIGPDLAGFLARRVREMAAFYNAAAGDSIVKVVYS